jgi:hypothetical protein
LGRTRLLVASTAKLSGFWKCQVASPWRINPNVAPVTFPRTQESLILAVSSRR